jgi:subtilase family serine protease
VTFRHLRPHFALAAVASIAAATALAFTGASALGRADGPAVPVGSARPATSVKASAADITIRPMLNRRFASKGGPLTTKECRKDYGFACYGPAQIQQAYNLKPLFANGIDGHGQTIVIVDAFGSRTIHHDLSVFDKHYSLPAPPSLRVIAPAGKIPAGNHAGWAGETTLDVEWAHSMAPGAKILLVETPVNENEGTSGFAQIVKAEKYVISHHLGSVISQSFGATENTFPSEHSLLRLRGAYKAAAANNVTVLAAPGDSGAADVNAKDQYFLKPVTDWPASDPLVTGVGGSKLSLNAKGNRLHPDRVWNDTNNKDVARYFGVSVPDPDAGGGGSSIIFGRPAFQNSVKSRVGAHRGVPDVSMNAACSSQVETYQSFPGQAAGWYLDCGTSEATPMFAGIVALADQKAGHSLGTINPALYALAAEHAPGIVDITTGNNTTRVRRGGSLHTIHGATARRGYDEASGVGTVNGAQFVRELAAR